MQNALTKHQLITAILVQAAILYGCIFVVSWLSPKACSTDFWPPSFHCRWDLGWRPLPHDAEQSKAFIEKAREIEADEKHSAADKRWSG
jgi:hypothetical protein